MIKSIFLRPHPHKAPQDAHIPVWPLSLIVIVAFSIAVAIVERLDGSIVSVSPFLL